jgi:Uma2 family endonuclease
MITGCVMDERFAAKPRRPTTQAADGLPRWRWTVSEIERLFAAGFFAEHDQFELLGGEIVPMSLKGASHELIREELSFQFTKLAPHGMFVASRPQLKLGEDTLTEPDILVRPAAIKTHRLSGAYAVLLVEVAADGCLDRDLKTKAALYASNGIPECWVINTLTFMTTVHLRPNGIVYADIEEFPYTEWLVPSRVPELAVSLKELLDID